MIKSMTGFGRAEIIENDRRYTVEVKTVNHRYLEANIKIPKALSLFESSIRGILKEYLERGKVDMFITFEDNSVSTARVKYNSSIAHEYGHAIHDEYLGKFTSYDNDQYTELVSIFFQLLMILLNPSLFGGWYLFYLFLSDNVQSILARQTCFSLLSFAKKIVNVGCKPVDVSDF